MPKLISSLANTGFNDAHAGENSSEKIRVRLFDSNSQIRVRKVADPETEWLVRCKDGKIQVVPIRHEKSNHSAANGTSAGGAARVPASFNAASPLVIHSKSKLVEVEFKQYRDTVKIYSDGDLCHVINELSVEDYLGSLVNSEFSSKWNEEAVAAQVIAARTYAVFQKAEARKRNKIYDLDSTINDQVYDGSGKENEKSTSIVRKTRGLILVPKNSVGPQPIKAFYHSTCGGRTELPEVVWGKKYPGFKKSVECPYCKSSPVLHWELEMELSEIQTILEKAGAITPLLQFGRLVDVRVGPRSKTNRIPYLISVWETDGKFEEVKVPAARFRTWIGPTRLKSTSFDVTKTGSMIRFEGQGNGHGVGLCQWGAKVMGEKGYKMGDILKHYYPDATLRKIW